MKTPPRGWARTIWILWCLVGGTGQLSAQTSDTTIAELRAAVAAERHRIADLEAELAKRQASLTDIVKRIDALAPAASAQPEPAPKAAPVAAVAPPRFDFYGDTLTRLSTLHQDYDGCAGCPHRTIGRMRLRFGVQGQIAPGVRAVMGLSAGELNDPNSVYQTFGGNLSRKVVSWDRGYIAYRPPQAAWMELAAGKFPYPWVRSSLTFDVDFYPEGASERFSFNTPKAGVLKNVSVQGMQVVVNEQANQPDMLLLGGQAIAGLRLGSRVASRIIATGFDIRRPELILRSQIDGSNVGVRNTNVITTDPGPQYASSFRYVNVMFETDVRTAWPSLPVVTTIEWHRNLHAASDRDTAGAIRVDVGRPQRRGDWLFGWHVFRVEQEAILSALGESDWRAPSNVLQHRIASGVNLHNQVQALFTWYRGRTLDSNAPQVLLAPGLPRGARDPWANRFYFDVLYRF